jgi:hypothetical protein
VWHYPTLRRKYRALPYVDAPIRSPDPIDEFRESVAWLFGFLQRSDIKLIALGQPVLWRANMTAEEQDSLWFPASTAEGPVRPSTAWLLNEMQRYNRAQKEEAEKLGFDYVDLDRLVPKSLEYYYDDCHHTDKGSARVAEAAFPTLKRMLEAMAQ